MFLYKLAGSNQISKHVEKGAAASTTSNISVPNFRFAASGELLLSETDAARTYARQQVTCKKQAKLPSEVDRLAIEAAGSQDTFEWSR